MRLFFSLNPKKEKENDLINFLDSKLNAAAYIKEILYQEMMREKSGIIYKTVIDETADNEKDDKYEKIKNISDIEI